MNLTRRQLMATAAGSAVAVRALAQSAPAQPVSPTPADFAQQARDGVLRNADLLARFAIPMSTEPAFQFKA